MAKDTIELNAFNRVKMPKLKGHIKLTLHNCRTGKNEVYEGDNIVTNAVADILGSNYAGGIDFNALVPLWQKWYGGALCYESAFPLVNNALDPNDYFIQADSTNHVTAHAGQTAIDTEHDDDSARGNPVGASVVQTSDSIKLVWEWGTVKGNGNISAIALTHTDTGSYGTGSTYYDFVNSYQPFEIINRTDSAWTTVDGRRANPTFVNALYDEAHTLCFLLGEGTYTMGASSDKITVFINKMAVDKIGLYQTLKPVTTLNRQFTVQIPFTCYSQPSYYFDDVNKYLWIFSNLSGAYTYSTTDVKYCVIDCENEELVNLGTEQSPVYYKTIISDTSNLAITNVGKSDQMWYNEIYKNGDYLYFLTSTGYTSEDRHITGFKKISLTTPSDQSSIAFNRTMKRGLISPIGNGDVFAIAPFNDTTSGTAGESMVVNGSTGYTCKSSITVWSETDVGYFVAPTNKVSTTACGTYLRHYVGTDMNRYILASKLVNTTKYNLSSTITKNATQSMSLEYTLTETSGS